MGCFSWLKADGLTRIANIVTGKPFKFLIPKEFGGGFIKECYQDYGRLGRKELCDEEKYDIYELIAFWNYEMVLEDEVKVFDFEQGRGITLPAGTKIADVIKYNGKFPNMKEVDKYTEFNRCVGISIGCYDNQIDKLKYPPKLVSASYKGTYEDCAGRSYEDPNQGWGALYRKDMK